MVAQARRGLGWSIVAGLVADRPPSIEGPKRPSPRSCSSEGFCWRLRGVPSPRVSCLPSPPAGAVVRAVCRGRRDRRRLTAAAGVCGVVLHGGPGVRERDNRRRAGARITARRPRLAAEPQGLGASRLTPLARMESPFSSRPGRRPRPQGERAPDRARRRRGRRRTLQPPRGRALASRSRASARSGARPSPPSGTAPRRR